MLTARTTIRRGLWLLAGTLVAGSLAGCSAPRADLEARLGASPTLEEIFLIPGLHGRPPRPHSISADGEWILFHWNPLERGEQGLRIERRGSLRLASTTPANRPTTTIATVSSQNVLLLCRRGDFDFMNALKARVASNWAGAEGSKLRPSPQSNWLLHAPPSRKCNARTAANISLADS